ncbi:hypothetical protein BD414DRAFT_490815 [Trametes punicea]|nr:hypothetical protein BD414DRAFT_490815 [Trametes punicea]
MNQLCRVFSSTTTTSTNTGQLVLSVHAHKGRLSQDRMSPIRTRARARRENIVPERASERSASARSLSNRPRVKVVAGAKRRETTFVIEKEGRRIVLADRTAQLNVARHAIAERRKTSVHPVLPKWVEVAAVDLPPKANAVTPKKRLAARPRQTPGVHWSRDVQIFSFSARDDTPGPSRSPGSISVHRDSSPAASPVKEPYGSFVTAEKLQQDARGRTLQRESADTLPSGVTVRSRSRTRSRARPSQMTTAEHPGGISWSSSADTYGRAQRDPLAPHGRFHLIRESSGSSPELLHSRPRSAPPVLTPFPRRAASTLTLQGACAPRASSAVTFATPQPVQKRLSDVLMATHSQDRLYPVVPLIQPASAVNPRRLRLNRLDQYILWFSIAYTSFISLMFARMFGIC